MIKTTIIFVLFLSFSIQAQRDNPFFKAQDTINAILAKNPRAYYVANNGLNKKIKNIKANENGRLRIIDAVYSEVDSSAIVSKQIAEVFIDLFEFERLKIDPTSVQLLDKNNKVYGTIYNVDIKFLKQLERQFDFLKEYCVKNKSIDFIKQYYFDFSTGYDFGGKYVTITDNYKVKFNESQFTLTFDTFDNNVKSNSATVSFNLKDIIAIEPSGMAFVNIVGEEYGIPVNGKLMLKTPKEEYELNIYYEVDEDVTTTEIYKAFEEVIKHSK
jgi:hypothetical protein